MTKIHATAVVDSSAELDSSVIVDAHAVIGANVKIGADTHVGNGVTIRGKTTIGQNNEIFAYAAIGFPPQDRKYKGSPTSLTIGNGNTIREFSTINTGTETGGGLTQVGSDNLIMAYGHVAHDCVVENDVILSAGVLLAGHVKLESSSIISGGSAINQFVTVGRLAYIGGLTRVVQDVPPYMITEGNPQRVRTANAIGMQRNGLSTEACEKMREAYKALFDPSVPWTRAVEALEQKPNLTDEVRYLIDFLRLRNQSKNGRAREALRNK